MLSKSTSRGADLIAFVLWADSKFFNLLGPPFCFLVAIFSNSICCAASFRIYSNDKTIDELFQK